MRRRVVIVEAAWFFICVSGWLVISLIAAENEADCRDSGGFLCFSTGEVFHIVGVITLGVFVIGALAIAGVWAVAWAITGKGRGGIDEMSRP